MSGAASNVARDSSDARVLPQRGAVITCPGHESDHGAVGIDKAVGGAETAADDIIAPELRKLAADFVAGDKAYVLQSHGNLLFVVGAQVGHMIFIGRAK